MSVTSSLKHATVEAILQAMGISGSNAAIQRIQSCFRYELVKSWGIQPGARVLEIGCGQGDMTAVLAHRVGSEGRITAIDPASADYGAPITIGQATARIGASDLGQRIDFRLGCNLLDLPPLGTFDYVVFAHCSWYFHSTQQLAATLGAARHYAPVLCFSEWDSEPRLIEQLGHMLAVQILGLVAGFDREQAGNVQTPLARSSLKTLVESAGWRIAEEQTMRDPQLQDGSWEIAQALSVNVETSECHDAQLRTYLASQIELLRQWRLHHAIAQPLDGYTLRATH